MFEYLRDGLLTEGLTGKFFLLKEIELSAQQIIALPLKDFQAGKTKYSMRLFRFDLTPYPITDYIVDIPDYKQHFDQYDDDYWSYWASSNAVGFAYAGMYVEIKQGNSIEIGIGGYYLAYHTSGRVSVPYAVYSNNNAQAFPVCKISIYGRLS